jgi:hypothetical protein
MTGWENGLKSQSTQSSNISESYSSEGIHHMKLTSIPTEKHHKHAFKNGMTYIPRCYAVMDMETMNKEHIFIPANIVLLPVL